MTVSARSVVATLGGQPLDLSDGSTITLDGSRAPYGSGEIVIGMPSAAILAALDPRVSPPPRVQVGVTDGALTRSFDLHVRSRAVRLRGAEVVIPVATDEALLTDYAPLSDDLAPLGLAGSLRSVVGYVIGRVSPGAVLETSPASDAVATMLDVDNLVTNPSLTVGAAGWAFYTNSASGAGARTAGANPDGTGYFYRCAFTSTAAGVRAGAFYTVPSGVRPGNRYTASTWARTNFAQTIRVAVEWKDSAGAALTEMWSSPIVLPANTWTRCVLPSVEAPANAARMVVTIYGETGGTVWNNGKQLDVTGLRVGPTASEPLVWRAGVTALDFLHTLLQRFGMRLVCDEARKWTLRSETYSAAGRVSLREGVNIVEADDELSRDEAFWFDARVTRYNWTGADGAQLTAVDAYALTPSYSRVTTVDVDAPYPGPGRSAYAVRRAQGAGREVTATTRADWTATADQSVDVTLPGAPLLLGTVRAVVFDLMADQMTLTTRTTDMPAGAVDLLTGTVDALTGTVNAL